MKLIGEVLHSLFSEGKLAGKMKEYRAFSLWSEVVGSTIASHTTAERMVKGVLYVRVDSSVWFNELSLIKEEIRNKLNQRVGVEVVKDIKFFTTMGRKKRRSNGA